MAKRWLVSLLLVSGCLLTAAVSPAAESHGNPGPLTGTVTDLEGHPLAGIPLWAIPTSSYRERDLPPTAFSGPDGSFAIPGLPAGAIELYACGAGYVHESRTVWFRNRPVPLKLQTGAILRGRVTGPDGAPVSGAGLYPREIPMILAEDSRIISLFPEMSPPCPDANSVTSGEDGRFELPSLLPGRYAFDIFADGLTTEERYPVRLSPGDVVDGLEIRLQSDGTREGRLVEPGGAPLPSAYVTASDGEDDAVTHYSADGTFRFTPPKDRPVALRIEADGYEILQHTIAPGDTNPVELLLVRDESWKTVRGRVVGPDGKPIEGAGIVPVTEEGEIRSAADGTFEVQLSLREIQPIAISKEGFGSVWIDLGPETPLDERITVRLEPGAVVTGRVRGLTNGDRDEEVQVRLRDGASPLDVPVQPDGTFRFENVPSGTWSLAVETAYRSAQRLVVVKPGQTELSVDLALPRTVPVSGRVLDSAGRPAGGAELAVVQGDEIVERAGTRKDGRFTLRVPQGDVEVYVGGLEVPESRKVDLRVGRSAVQGLVIRLEPTPGTRMTGRLLGLAAGEEAEIVGVLDEPRTAVRARIEGDRFEMPLEPGFWMLHAALYDAAGTYLRSVRWTFEIQPGETEKEQDLDLADAKAVPEEEP